MEKVTNYIEKIKSDAMNAKNIAFSDIKKRRLCIDISFYDFAEILKILGQKRLYEKQERKQFVIDNDNIDAVKALYDFSLLEPKYCKKPGIALVGLIGSGKSILLDAYFEFMLKVNSDMFKPIPKLFVAKNLIKMADNDGNLPRNLLKSDQVLFLDELGREPKVIDKYKNEYTPIIDLLFERDRLGQSTIITSNYGLKVLSEPSMYGEVIGDRMKAMFDFVVVKGGSRRS